MGESRRKGGGGRVEQGLLRCKGPFKYLCLPLDLCIELSHHTPQGQSDPRLTTIYCFLSKCVISTWETHSHEV